MSEDAKAFATAMAVVATVATLVIGGSFLATHGWGRYTDDKVVKFKAETQIELMFPDAKVSCGVVDRLHASVKCGVSAPGVLRVMKCGDNGCRIED